MPCDRPMLMPCASPPTIFGVEPPDFLPLVLRERAGFIDRLGQYVSTPPPRRAFFILAGKRLLPPVFELLGDPLRSDAQGHNSDVPFAAYWPELLGPRGLHAPFP